MRTIRIAFVLGLAALSAAVFAAVAGAASIEDNGGGHYLRGTPDADTVIARGGRDHVAALPGDDTVYAGWGWDVVHAGIGNDTVRGQRGRDSVFGGAGDDHLFGGPHWDRLWGMLGNDEIDGGGRHDRIFAGDGDDAVRGGWGWDLISGGNGNDVTNGGPGRDRIFANLGNDTTYGDAGNDDLWALAIKDVDTSGGPDTAGDTLVGGPGADTLRTRDGELDRVDCGPGRRDNALLDSVDVIVDATQENPNGSCERVVRAAPNPDDSRTEDGQQSPEDDGTDG